MKTKTRNKQSHSRFPSRLKPAYAAILLAFSVNSIQANPLDPTVVSGQASFNTTGSTLTVTNTPGAIIHWQGFSIGANEITRFAQQSASSAVLNRVVSNNPSSILGTLQSNGRVFLINPNGIVFGAGSTVDVAGLVASTLNLSNADFLAGRYSFTEVPGAQNISNAGNISSQEGGQIYLIAPDVENTGVITAPNGEILLAAGHSVDLVNTNSPNLIVNITAPAGDATNVGQLIASSGSLGLFGTVVRNSGAVSADSATMQGGKIVFRSSQHTEAGGTVSAQGVGGGEIRILSDMQTGTVSVTGTLDASAPVSGDGGFIDTSAAHVQVADTARITTAALNGNYGTWLIDPTDYTISAIDPANGSSWMSGATLGSSLDLGNVTIQTLATGGGAGDILINDNVTKVSTGMLTSLTLQAHNNILISANNSISSTGFALDVVLNSNNDVVGGGGIYLDTGSSIVSNGGNITLGGAPSVGYAIGNGSVTGGKTFNSGIYVLGNITAGAGNVTMRGEGASNTLADGITFAGGTLSSNGIVNIDGIAHFYGTNRTGLNPFAAGVDFINAGTRLTTQTGTVNVTGTNTAPWSGIEGAGGIMVETGTIVETTGGGTLSFTGAANSYGASWGVGVLGTIQTTAAGGGALTLNGTNLLNADGGVVIWDGHVLSGGGAINLIGETSAGGSAVGFLNTAPNALALGGPNSGNITIQGLGTTGFIDFNSSGGFTHVINAGSSALSISGGSAGYTLNNVQISAWDVTLNSGGAVTDNNASTSFITANTLRLLGTGPFNLGSINNNVGTLAANVTGNVAYKDSNGFIIGSVTSFDGTATTNTTGVTTNNSNFTGTTVGNITLNAGSAINTGKGALNLSATGGNLNINGDVSAGTFTLSGGTWNQVSATLPGFTVNDFRIPSGTFIRALSGDGTITPYQLADIYGVQGMGSAGMLGYSYELANGINAAGTVNWNAGAGFVPVGNGATSFTGQFDGLGYTISNLVINRPTTSYVGLFGYAVGSSIMNVGLVNSSVTGGSDVGALAGYSSGTIGNSYVSGGSVSGSYDTHVGGLVGSNSGTISNSHVSGASVLGNSSVGGLVGYNFGSISISISNSYVSGGSVTGSWDVGGLVGHNGSTTTITNSYSTGNVTGSVNVGGLVGTNSGTITDSYWDITTSGQATSAGGTGLTTVQMMTQASYTGFDFTNTWWMIDGNTRPFLRSEWNTNITNAHQLQLAGMDATTLAATYTLKNDIDLAPALAAGGMWSSSGFAPIGNATTNFTGTFDGLGHTISNLSINRPATSDIGLFGVTGAASAITNVGLDLASVTGYDKVGALVGNANGGITNSYASATVAGRYWVGGLMGIANATITDVYSTGTVNGQGSVGGLVGASTWSTISSSYSAANDTSTGIAQKVGGFVGDATWSTISNSYSTGSVVGSSSVGGFAGGMDAGGTGVAISNSYSTGAVTGTTNVGGFIGINAGARMITNSFWDIATSGQATSAGGTGFTLTSAAMIQANYTGWDFTNTWWMSNANTRPFLRSEYSTNITNAHQLQLMAMNATTLGASYTLGANIDAAETALGIGMWSSAGFVPVGNLSAFAGQFDGLNHTISNLYINGAGDLGLFSVVTFSGVISNVGLLNSVVLSTGSGDGALAGSNAGTINNSYADNATVTVTGTQTDVGGLVGSNSGTINNSYVRNSNVHGEYSKLGGLAGSNSASGNISNSYVSGGSVVSAATWSAPVGGLVGNNDGSISNSYVNGGSVTSVAPTTVGGPVGGLVGLNSGSVSTSYASNGTLVSNGGGLVGGLVCENSLSGSISNSFWDSDTTGAAIPVGANSGSVTGVAAVRSSTATVNAYSASAYSGFDFTTTWWMSNTNTRPFLQSEYSTTITNSHQLQLMAMNLGASYKLDANIDMAETASGTGMWGSAGFVPVGSSITWFTGQLDGQGHTISNLTINRSATNYVGLFGYLDMGAIVSNVGLTGGSVTGSSHVGSLAGYNAASISNSNANSVFVSGGSTAVGGLVGKNDWGGSISNSYVDNGSVTGAWKWAGGLAGLNFGNIDNSHVSYTTVTVVSGNSVGGLVGWNDGSIGNSYVSNGSVTGSSSVGGLVGWNTSIISNSYVISNSNVTGTWNIGGLVGANYVSISDSYVVSANVSGSDLVGGLAGFSNGSISNSYVSSGSVWGSSNVGGLLGMNYGLLANSHYNIDVVSIYDGNYVTLGGLFGAQYVDWYGTGIPATGGLNLNIADYSTLPGSGNNFTISNVQGMKDLLGFADNAAYTFSLGADIDLALDAGLFIPYLAASFSGSDGTNFYTISNLNVNQSFNDSLGLFGHIATGSTVSNVALLNAAVMGNSNVGALAGWNEGAISNSHVSGATTAVSGVSNVGGLAGYSDFGSISNSDVNGGSVTGSSNVGGLVGQNYFSTIDGSHVSAVNVDGGTTGLYVGGLVGQDRWGAIGNSYVDSGTVVTGGTRVGGLLGFDGGEGQGVLQSNTVSDTTVTGSNYVGGLVGSFDTYWGATGYVDDNHVVDSFVYGRAGSTYLGGLTGWNGAPISNSSVSGTTVSGGTSFVGGLVGYNTIVGSSPGAGTTVYWGGLISNSYVSGGTVSGNSSVGGLAGSNAGEISNSFVSGSAISGGSTGSASNVGGLAGNNNGGILNSYASGGTVTGGNNVGGLVGNNVFSGIISFSYADVGSVTGLSNVGGVVGYNYQGTVGDTFWNTALAGGNLANGIGNDFFIIGPTDVGAAGLTAAQLKTMSSFTGWSITNTGGSVATWRIYEGNTTPLLSSFLTPLTATANNAVKTYDGNAFSGGNGVGYSVTPTLTLLGTPAYGGTSQGAVNAGGYTITASGLYSDQLGYDISYVDGALAVNPYAVSMTGSRTYDGTANVAAGIFTLGPLVGTETLTLGGSGSVSSANVSAGSQTVTLGTLALGNGTGLASNYTFTGGTQTAAINPATLIYTANAANRLYGAANPALSGSVGGFVLGESLATATTGSETYTTTATSTSNAGSYAITGSGLTANFGNYTFVQAAANSSAFTINPALLMLSVTASDASKTYGTTLTFNGTEFVPVGLQGGDTISGVTLASAGAVDTANAGTYAITPSNAVFSVGSASNYTLSYVDGQLTVTARPVSVTANAISRVYGDADPALTYAVGGLGLTSWDTNATAFTGALARAAGENVAASPYAISQGTLTASNYTITFAGNIFTITPAPLSVYAYPTNKIISTPDPLLGYMVSGLKLGDTAAATLNSGSLARDAGEAVGNYQINQGSLALASSNYTMNYFPASFTILAPTVVDEIANAILLLGTPDTGSAQSTSSSDEEKKRKAEEEAVAAGTPASGDTAAQPLPVCPGA